MFLPKWDAPKYSTYLLVRVVVKNPWQQMRDVKLNGDAQTLLQNNPEEFRQSYGDEFINGLITGGEYYAILDVKATNQEDKQRISSSIRAEGLSWEVAGAFKKAVLDIAKTYDIAVISEQMGGKDTRLVQNIEEIIERAVSFPDQVREISVPYQAIFLDYKAIAGNSGTNLINITNQRQVIEKLWNYRSKLLDTLSDIEYVLDNADQFHEFSHQKLNDKANKIRLQINNITDLAAKYASNYQACKLPTNLIDPVPQLPQRRKVHFFNNPRDVNKPQSNSKNFEDKFHKTFTRIDLLALQFNICLRRTVNNFSDSDREIMKERIKQQWLQEFHVYAFDEENFCRLQLILSIDWENHEYQLSLGKDKVVIDDKWQDNTAIELDEAIRLFDGLVKNASLRTEWRVVYSDFVNNDLSKKEEIRSKLGLQQSVPIKWASGEIDSGEIPGIPELSEFKIGLKWVS